jgi:hypothetical protein
MEDPELGGAYFCYIYLIYVGNLARLIVRYSANDWGAAVIQTSQEAELSVLWITIHLFLFPMFVAMLLCLAQLQRRI